MSTWMTPDCSSTARALSSSMPESLRICEGATAVRPAFTAMIGLLRDTRRARRENLRGLPKLSRYNRITSVASSASQYCSRSLPDRSARLPAETNVDRPS